MFRSDQARRYTCALVLALATATTSARAAESVTPAAALTGKRGGLTADEVARRATATSYAAAQKRQEVIAATAALDRAVYDFLPRLSGSASYFRLSKVESSSLGNLVVSEAPGPLAAGQPLMAVPLAFDSLQNATTFSGSLTVPLSDYAFRLFQQRAAAKAQLLGSQQALEATRRKAAYDARALYYDWVRAELDAVVAEQNLALSREHLTRLQALASADSAAPADVARVAATAAAAEHVLAQAQNVAALQRERVGIAMHAGPERGFAIGEDLTQALPERPELDDLAELIRQAERQRPELKAAAFTAVAHDKQADATRARLLPRLDAIAQSTLANPNQRYFPQQDEFNASWQVGVQLSFALNDTLSGKTQLEQARAQAASARAQAAELRDAVRAEVVEAVLAHRTARASLSSSSRRLAAAEISYRARRERFDVGQATTVELTEAQTELFNAALEATQAQVAIRVARARLAHVTGREP